MRRINPFLGLCIILLTLASCQKETSVDTLGGTGTNNGGGSNTGNTEVGNWKFINTHVKGSQTAEMNDGIADIKTITLSDYITEKNDGTYKLDGSKATGTGITYSVNTTSKAYMYSGGSLVDTFDFPWTFTLPPYNTSGTYKKISSDSLYFDSGVLGAAGSGGSTQSAAGGCKLKFDGDKMMMTMVVNETKYESVQGLQAKVTTQAVVVTTLQRQ